uniref:Nudix hydrolase domain-containing protein n=1 Tax=viral metagenome TaxID=1070528 RepID=A0A6C0CRJ2_9ZZZZ
MSNRAYIFCNNCGESGHAFHQCKHPITSIGTVVYTRTDEGIKYLLICRKDSLGYVDFMRGKYPLNNKTYIEHIFSEMTNIEKERIMNNTFDDLWKNLWGENIGIQYRGEERVSREKLSELTNGINIGGDSFTLKDIIDNSEKNWHEPEWGFPKGRRNYQEKDLSCALREFEEETGYPVSSLSVVQNVMPYEEIFTGSNYKSYKHCYYLAEMKNVVGNGNYQKSEVSKISWLSYDEALEKIRPYNLEKKEVLKKINTLLTKYRLCS